MRRRIWICIALLAAFAAPASAGDSMSLNGFRHHALPVLVKVDAKGEITQVLPSVALSPRTDRLLRSNLDQMITEPAKYKGKPVSSQFVIQLALVAEHGESGGYKAHFTYVSAMPVPAGTWYWVRIDGHRLALAEDEGGRRHLMRFHRGWQPMVRPDPWPSPYSPAQMAPSPTMASPPAPMGGPPPGRRGGR